MVGQSSIKNSEEIEIKNFTTERLKPLKQSTKHGKLEILGDGSVFVDFNSEGEAITISKYGTSISVHPKNDSGSATFALSNAPVKFHKMIRYASRFVDLVRSKTPKVCFVYIGGVLFPFSKMYTDGKHSRC
jgi:uncharacterized protein YigE (DUF2233 family)